MRPIQRIIATGFATAAIASASLPALSWTVWPDVDFEWYANVGRTASAQDIANDPRRAPARIERVETRDGVSLDGTDDRQPRDTVIVPADQQQAPVRAVPSGPDTQSTNPTLPYTGSNRR